MPKLPAKLFPQRIEVCNRLLCTRITEDQAVLATDLGQLRVPLAWWRDHRHDPAIVLVVVAVEAVPRHEGAMLAEGGGE